MKIPIYQFGCWNSHFYLDAVSLHSPFWSNLSSSNMHRELAFVVVVCAWAAKTNPKAHNEDQWTEQPPEPSTAQLSSDAHTNGLSEAKWRTSFSNTLNKLTPSTDGMLPSKGSIHWMKGKYAPTKSISIEFRKILTTAQQTGTTWTDPQNNLDWVGAKPTDYAIVMVPGLLTQLYGSLYMTGAIQTLQDLGCDVTKADINTGKSVAENGLHIADFIADTARRTGKKVVVMAQSKGVCDTLQALATNKGIWNDIHRVVMTQGVVGGTPVATDALEQCGGPDFVCQASKKARQAVINFVMNVVLKGSSQQALQDLTYSNRQKWFNQYNGELTSEITDKIFSVATHEDRWTSGLGVTTKYMKQFYNVNSDGLVPLPSQYVPGSYAATVNGMDHADGLFSATHGAKYGDQQFTRASLFAALTLMWPGSPCANNAHCRSRHGWCGTGADYCNSKSTWKA